MKIALVEDDPVFTVILKDFLKGQGCRVLHIETIYAFEQLLHSFDPDLIITDVLISGVSTKELIDYYLQFRCPILVMSSINKEDLNYFAERVKAIASFQKPFNPTELDHFIDSAKRNSIVREKTYLISNSHG